MSFLVAISACTMDHNCSAYSETVTSHALGGLTGSRSTLLHMQSERRADVFSIQ